MQGNVISQCVQSKAKFASKSKSICVRPKATLVYPIEVVEFQTCVQIIKRGAAVRIAGRPEATIRKEHRVRPFEHVTDRERASDVRIQLKVRRGTSKAAVAISKANVGKQQRQFKIDVPTGLAANQSTDKQRLVAKGRRRLLEDRRICSQRGRRRRKRSRLRDDLRRIGDRRERFLGLRPLSARSMPVSKAVQCARPPSLSSLS